MTTELKLKLDFAYDSIRVYRLRTPYEVEVDCLGQQEGHTDTVL